MSKTGFQKHGIVEAFNVSPKGSYEGLLLRDKSGLLQINFPQEWAATITEFAPEGEEIDAEVMPEEEEKGHAAHDVYRLLGFTSSKRKEEFSLADSNGNSSRTFSGTVRRLNYALHGEVNGAILDSGDFLHLKPHGASALKLAVGMKVKGMGSTKPMVAGHHVIEAEEVNEIRLERKPGPKKKSPHPKHE